MANTDLPESEPTGSSDTDPREGEEFEVIQVEYAPDDGTRKIGPFVVAVAVGVVASMVFEGGKYVIPRAWNAVTKAPVLDFTRPPTVYNPTTGLVYRLQGDGSYRPSGTAMF